MVLVDLATGTVVAEPDDVATVLEPTADEAALQAAAGGNAGPIAIAFPSFTDGRGFSLARLLRERHGFKGEIRAVGYLIPDHGQFLLRSGFDTAEIADPDAAQVWKASLERIRHNYQPAVRNKLPLRWDASRKAAIALDEALSATDDLVGRIKEVASRIEGRIAFSTSLGLEDQAILHAIAKSGADIDIFTLDTGRLFPEVLETVELSELRFRRRIRLVVPDAQEVEELVSRDGVYGFRQSVANRKSCCEIRKVRPLNRALEGAQGWLTGLRREHSEARSDVPLAEWDAERGLVKVNPVADWSTDELMAYIEANNIPVNPLHARGFVSIGCAPCTRAIQPGEDPRAGRWWWENEDKKECGLHVAETARQKEKAA
jgi:phosphoadenosine phosphosulfate reductase